MEQESQHPTETVEEGTLPADARQEAHAAAESRAASGMSLRTALEKSMESLSKALSTALEDRANVVMVRVNDEALHHLDMLVEAEVTKSRSESAAFLISEGIRANAALFARIEEITRQIAELRAQLRKAMESPE